MGKREKFNTKHIQSDVKELGKIDKKLAASREKKKCMCCHQKNGIPAIRKANNKNGRGVAICPICGKEIWTDLNPCKPENFSKVLDAIELLDNACDMIKLTLNDEHPADLEVLEAISKYQFFGRMNLGDLVKGVSRKNNKSRNRGRNDEGNSWGKPINR